MANPGQDSDQSWRQSRPACVRYSLTGDTDISRCLFCNIRDYLQSGQALSQGYARRVGGRAVPWIPATK
jgi:hypothetical protein